MHCCIPTHTTDNNTRIGVIWVTFNMVRSAPNRQGNVMELWGNFTLSGEWSPCFLLAYFSAYGSPIILVFPVLYIFVKFRLGHPLWGHWMQVRFINFTIFNQYLAICGKQSKIQGHSYYGSVIGNRVICWSTTFKWPWNLGDLWRSFRWPTYLMCAADSDSCPLAIAMFLVPLYVNNTITLRLR